ILDRTGIIIDIFNIHAKSNESKKQVELAKLEYMLPRLTRQWSHLERQMGGTGTRGGPGEKQIEIDRRLIRREIDKLKKDLSKISQSREIQRKKRNEAVCVSLAGYTNAGKSSLMNRLTGANVYIENELFATLDSTTKILDLDISQKILLSDTVGFIQKLPHELVASFQTTLSDIKRADLILKVIDSSYSNLSMHIDTIEKTLKELNSSTINSIFVFNKIDLIDNKQMKVLLKRYPESIFISCQDNSGIDYLIEYIKNSIRERYIQKTLKIKYSQLNYINDIYENLDVLKRQDKENYILVKVEGSKEKIKWIQSKLKT
ncbi:MAG: GTPase HflX, partial [Candidatus Marinimicrobia bacterium]|nr:GTPase HflX [Candidatus Neomarinimicrobiota bacterium]